MKKSTIKKIGIQFLLTYLLSISLISAISIDKSVQEKKAFLTINTYNSAEFKNTIESIMKPTNDRFNNNNLSEQQAKIEKARIINLKTVETKNTLLQEAIRLILHPISNKEIKTYKNTNNLMLSDKPNSSTISDMVKELLVIFKYLTKQDGIQLDLQNKNGETCLHLIFDGLYNRNLDARLPDDCKKEIVNLLEATAQNFLTKYAEKPDKIGLNLKDKDGKTLLEYAALQGNDEDMVKLLLKCDGIDVNLKLKEGRAVEKQHIYSSLVGALARKGQTNMVKILLASGKIDVKPKEGVTPLLHEAIDSGDEDMVKEVLAYLDTLSEEDAKEIANQPNAIGYRPLSYANSKMEKGIAALLKESRYVNPRLWDTRIPIWVIVVVIMGGLTILGGVVYGIIRKRALRKVDPSSAPSYSMLTNS